VEATAGGLINGQSVAASKVTVEGKLRELRATCSSENKLVDANGKPIVFYDLIGCWGYPPPNYQELLQKQRRELEKLKQDSTVVEMTCNPSAAQIP